MVTKKKEANWKDKHGLSRHPMIQSWKGSIPYLLLAYHPPVTMAES